MAKTYANLESRVRANVNNTSAVVATVIDDAIDFLGNFFSLEKITTSVSTVANQIYIARPSLAKEIERIVINDEEYLPMSVYGIKEAEEYELCKFIDTNAQIQIYPTPTAIYTTKIWHTSGFTVLGGVTEATSDVPDNLIPILCVIATWFFWQQMASKTATARELFPDMTPEEALENAKSWKTQFEEMLKLIQNQK